MTQIFTFLRACHFFWGFAQDHRRDFSFSGEIIQQRSTFAEANLFMGTILAEMNHPRAPHAVGVSGVRIGVESDFNETIAPKIGYEFALMAYYGYGIPFNNGHLTDIGRLPVGLSFNFNGKLGEAASELFLNQKRYACCKC